VASRTTAESRFSRGSRRRPRAGQGAILLKPVVVHSSRRPRRFLICRRRSREPLMIGTLIETALRLRCLVLLRPLLIAGFGVYAFQQQRSTRIPTSRADGADHHDSSGRAPEEVERQVTVPMKSPCGTCRRSRSFAPRTIFGLAVRTDDLRGGNRRLLGPASESTKSSPAFGCPTGAQATWVSPGDGLWRSLSIRADLDGTHDLVELRHLERLGRHSKAVARGRRSRGLEFRRTVQAVCLIFRPAASTGLGCRFRTSSMRSSRNNASGGAACLPRAACRS